MLAQNFKTAAELYLSDEEREAHIRVLGMLERGEMIHSDGIRPNGFNMGTTGSRSDCGTVACIGGWVAFLMDKKGEAQPDYVAKASGNQGCLYYPHFYIRINPRKITTEQAAIALRNYLTTGEPRWSEALAVD